MYLSMRFILDQGAIGSPGSLNLFNIALSMDVEFPGPPNHLLPGKPGSGISLSISHPSYHLLVT